MEDIAYENDCLVSPRGAKYTSPLAEQILNQRLHQVQEATILKTSKKRTVLSADSLNDNLQSSKKSLLHSAVTTSTRRLELAFQEMHVMASFCINQPQSTLYLSFRQFCWNNAIKLIVLI